MTIYRLIGGLAMAVALSAPLPVQAAVVTLATSLDGNSEPLGGDPDGSGRFSVELDAENGEVCYRYTVDKIGRPKLVQILRGPIGSNGPLVMSLEAGRDVCVDADPRLVNQMIANPGDYYVNFFNEEFPTGAIRGQLVGSQLVTK